MATTPGQRFVRRHNAARSSTSNTTAADISYDTAVISEGGYSWTSPEVTVDEAGLYLCIYDIGEQQLAGATRAVGTLVPSVNTTDQTYYKARHRYNRNSGGNHAVSWGACILDLSVNDDVKIRNPGTVSGTDAFGNYATNVNQGGGFQMIRLNAGNFTEVRRTSAQSPITITYANATRPWLDSTLLTTQLTFNSEVRDDDNLYSGSGGDLTLAANTKYLIVYGASLDGSSSQRQTHHLQLEINGNNVQYSTGYERNNSSDGPPMQGMYLHETGGSAETLRLNAGVEQEDSGVSNTVEAVNAYLQVLELPSTAEWIHADNGATDSLTTAWAGTTTYYDTPLSSTLRADGDSNLSLDAANNAIQNDSGGTLPVLAIGWMTTDRDAGVSGTRKHVWSYWDNGGTRLAYGISGGYNRGQQGNDDTHRLAFSGAATMDLANAADLSFVSRDPQSGANSDMGVYASTSRYFLGVQVLNLNTLSASSDTDVAANTDALTLTEQTASISLDVGVSATLAALTLAASAASVSVDTDVQAQANALSLTESQASITYDVDVAAGASALSLSENQASITHDITVNGSVATLTLTENQATIDVTNDTLVNANTDALTLTESQAAITEDVNVAGAVDALVLSEQQANVVYDVDVVTNLETLSVSTLQASITEDVEVNAGLASLSLSELQALAQLAPRVYLNTSQTLTGATEMTVVSWSTDGTSITFDDPAGAPTGSLFLGVQNTASLEVGWIAVNVTTGGTNVSANVDDLSLAEQQASITHDIDVSTNVDPLTLTESQASVTLDVDVQAGFDALVINPLPASLGSDTNVGAGTDALTLTEGQSSIGFDVQVGAGLDALTLTEPQASIALDVDISALSDALTLTEGVATITFDVDVAASTDALVINTLPATTGNDTNVGAFVDALTLAEQQSSVSLDVSVSTSFDALTLVGLQAGVGLDASIAANTAALSVTEYQSALTRNIDVQASPDTLAMVEYQASLSADTSISAGIDALSLATYQASFTYDVDVSALSDSLSITEQSASIVYDVDVLAGTDNLVISEFVAAVLIGSGRPESIVVERAETYAAVERRNTRSVVDRADTYTEVSRLNTYTVVDKRDT